MPSREDGEWFWCRGVDADRLLSRRSRVTLGQQQLEWPTYRGRQVAEPAGDKLRKQLPKAKKAAKVAAKNLDKFIRQKQIPE